MMVVTHLVKLYIFLPDISGISLDWVRSVSRLPFPLTSFILLQS